MKIRALLFCQSYPNPNKKVVGSPFAHVRVKGYLPNLDVTVMKISPNEESYTFEGVQVDCFKSLPDLVAACAIIKPKIILCHFVEPWMRLVSSQLAIPMIVWVHGSEAHSWYRILFNFYPGNYWEFIKFAKLNTFSLLFFNKIVRQSNKFGNIHFVFVSNWMKRIAAKDSCSRVNNFSIIPNPIDQDLFPFLEKSVEDRKKILILRSFNSHKYANDLIIKAILKLSKLSYFSELQFLIVGEGTFFRKLTGMVSNFKNVEIREGLVPQNQIPSLHSKFGVFLCPTRMDAQGVSMCEAMSSGLVPITSNNTAIPEFVHHKKTGLLTNSVAEIVESIAFLYNNPEEFKKLSKAASESIGFIAGKEQVISKELALINEKSISTIKSPQ